MSDKELLELAAKAMGLRVHEVDNLGSWVYAPSKVEAGQDQIVQWNPLIPSEDTVRMIAKLGLEHYEGAYGVPAAHVGFYIGQRQYFIIEPHGDDPAFALCRAATRAAAEIGRRMP